jgi:hypothetical protein
MTCAPAPAFCRDEPDRIERDFWAFHIANPCVYQELRDHALELRRRGRTHYGIKALFEVVRFHRALQTLDPKYEWKLNNNYSSLYARMLMANEPELRNFFHTRVRRAAFTQPRFFDPTPS